MSDDSTIVGKGHDILLPPQGNPFKKESSAEEPRDLSPTEIAARFGGVAAETPVGEAATPPMDLGPEDIAALFPSHHDDRNAIPGASDEAAPPPESAPPAPPPRMSARPPISAAPDGGIDLSAFNPDAPIGQPSALVEDVSPATMMADAASLKADAPPAEMETAAMHDSADTTPPVLAPESAPAESAAPTVGFKPLNPFAVSAEKPAEIMTPPPTFGIASPVMSESPDEAAEKAVTTGAYPVPPVPEDDTLVEKLITDARVEQLWQRIEAAEKMAVADENSLPSQRVANFENLKAARNLLLGGRKNYEDALRYVVEVESDLLYVGRVRRWSYTWGMFILFYNLVWLALLTLGYVSATRIATMASSTGVFDQAFGFTLWVTILSGGLGGVSKSLFSLASHVSKQDFDSQHRMWYFTSPLIGAVLGIFVILISQVGLIAVSAGGGSNSNAGLIVYILAWVVGFQQNIALKLVEQVVNLLVKQDSKAPTGETSNPADTGGGK